MYVGAPTKSGSDQLMEILSGEDIIMNIKLLLFYKNQKDLPLATSNFKYSLILLVFFRYLPNFNSASFFSMSAAITFTKSSHFFFLIFENKNIFISKV